MRGNAKDHIPLGPAVPITSQNPRISPILLLRGVSTLSDITIHGPPFSGAELSSPTQNSELRPWRRPLAHASLSIDTTTKKPVNYREEKQKHFDNVKPGREELRSRRKSKVQYVDGRTDR